MTTTLNAETGVVAAVAFSPDGKTLAIGGGYATILRNLATGTNAAVFPGSAGALAFSPDGTTLAVGGDAATLWDTATKQKTASFASPWQITSITFLPDGTTLAANDHNGVVMWTSAR
jgi:WD40 repeat protein